LTTSLTFSLREARAYRLGSARPGGAAGGLLVKGIGRWRVWALRERPALNNDSVRVAGRAEPARLSRERPGVDAQKEGER
jgi:hypothetical protein